MNNNLKLIVVAAASFASGYFVANHMNEQYYYDQANKQIDEAFENNEKLEELQKKVDQYEARDEALKVEEASKLLAEYQGQADFEPVDVHAHAAQHAASVPAKVQYSTYSAKEAEKQQPRDVQPENIEVITPVEFAEGKDDYDQPTFVYYSGDKVLASGIKSEGKIDDDLRALMLGSRSDVVDREGFWEGLNGEAFYLRNHDLKLDIEIIRADEDLKYFDETKNPGDNG